MVAMGVAGGSGYRLMPNSNSAAGFRLSSQATMPIAEIAHQGLSDCHTGSLVVHTTATTGESEQQLGYNRNVIEDGLDTNR